MRNKIYNFLISILVIAFIIVSILIVIKYRKQKVDSNKLTSVAKELRNQIENNNNENNNRENNKDMKINTEYKGYNIVGIIKIPIINLEYPIIDKTNDQAMKVSITKFWGNDINEVGNFSMAGHNYYGGTFFGNTKKLKNGDIIEMTDLTGRKIEYEVFDKYVTDPNDVTCVKSVKENTREITLITCTNGRSNRLIIKAREK